MVTCLFEIGIGTLEVPVYLQLKRIGLVYKLFEALGVGDIGIHLNRAKINNLRSKGNDCFFCNLTNGSEKC